MTDFKIQLPSDTPDPSLVQYYKNLENRTLVINEEISEELMETIVIPLLQMDAEDSTKPIMIYLNTLGGCIFSGFTMCDIIARLKSPVEIRVLGYAYSMGAYLLMAGANKPNIKRTAYPFSTCLIHGGSTILSGTGSQVKDTFNFMEKYEEKIKDYALSHSNITEEEYNVMDRKEWYMSAEDMLKYNLIDEII